MGGWTSATALPLTDYTNLLVEVVVHRQTEWIIQYHTKIFTNLYVALQTKSTWVCQLNCANHLSHGDGKPLVVFQERGTELET